MLLKRARCLYALLVLIFVGAVLTACSAVVPPNAALQAEQSNLRGEIESALTASPEEWPAARDRLVCAAHDVLPVLDARKVSRSEEARVTELISQALLHNVTYDEFRAYRVLHALVAPEIERRRQMTPVFTQLQTVHRGSFLPGCVDRDCPKNAFQQAEAAFEKLPGLSVPVLQELARHPKPAVRLYALLRMFEIESVLAAMKTAELLRDDTAEVPVARDDLEHQLNPVNAYAGITGRLALVFAEWNGSTVGVPDETEQSMITALSEAVALQECKWSPNVESIVAADAWGRAIRVAGTPGGIVMWSRGPNESAGDGDDIVRFLRNCDDFHSGNPFRWTAAGGGATALPAESKAKCN